MRRLGRILFVILLPFLRTYLRRTHRAYGLISCGDEVVVVKGWLARQTWQLPGGGIRRGESPEQAAIREVKEEVGIELDEKELKFLTSGRWQTDKLGQSYSVHQAIVTSKQNLKILRPELVDSAWVNSAELNQNNCPTEVLQALKAAHLL